VPELTKVTSDVISTNTISGLISAGFTSMNVATFGTQTIEFGSSNTLVFRANTSTERMRVSNTGFVGIGTSSPTQPLDIATPFARLAIRPSLTTSSALTQYQNSAGNAWVGLDSSTGGLGTIYGLHLYHAGAYPIVMATNGTERMQITANGNIGIATSNPAGKLDSSWGGRTAGQIPAILVGANSDSSTRSDNTQKMGIIGAAHYTNAQSPVGLISSNSYASNNDVYVGGGFAGSSAATSVSFWTAANSTTSQGTERMRITSAGNVGIGTSSPGSYGGFTTLSLNNSSGGGLIDFLYNGSRQSTIYGENTTLTLYTVAALPIQFYTSAVQRMQINAGAPVLCLAGGNQSATGTGIAFPATQNASADANTLDDYEEGTWTTSDGSGAGLSITTNANSAFYVKVGNLVMVRISVTYPSTASGASAALIIPFEQFGTSFFAGNGSIGYTTSSLNNLVIAVQNKGAGQYVLFYKTGGAAVTNAEFSGQRIDFTVIYRTV
jgi:uncharacterized protein YjlB